MKARWRKQALEEWRGVETDSPHGAAAQPIGDLLPEVMRKLGLGERFAEEEIGRAWAEVVDYPFCQQVVPVRLSRETLLVRVPNPVIQFAFEGMRAKYLRRLQERLGSHRIKDIRVTRR